jgi:hypothetical protein
VHGCTRGVPVATTDRVVLEDERLIPPELRE